MENSSDPKNSNTGVTPSSKNPFKKFKRSHVFDARIVSVLLLAIIVTMFILWHLDQQNTGSNARTVDVTGEATLTAEPDEYDFNPSYTFRNADKGAAISAATDKQTEVVAKLKGLGVTDKQIKTNLDGYEDGYGPVVYGAPAQTAGDNYVYTLTMTVTVPNRTLAQRVQDYLATTGPEGTVTPQVTFSDGKQKQLESKARELASADARNKADQSAKNLGFKVKGVKSVTDGSGFGGDTIQGGCGPEGLCQGVNLDTGKSAPSLAVQPGQDKFTFTVSVTYFIR